MPGRRILVSLVSVVAGLTAFASSDAIAAAPSPTPPRNCNASFDAYNYTQSALASCGIKTYPLSSVTPLPGGGNAYNYDENGTMVTDLVPPPGFNPAMASDAQLDEYGFPPRPTDPHALATWQDEMTQWTAVAPPTSFQVVDPNIKFDTVTSNNWSGYAISANPGFFNHAEAWYEEPYIYGSSCSSTAESTWAGIGGYSGSALGQDGTAYGENLGGIGSHQAWYEVIPGGGPQPINLYGHSGSEFDASTKTISGGYRFYVYDYYTHVSKAVDISTGSYSGDSAEVIVEHPTGLLSGLSNFGTMSFYQTEANGNYFNNYTASRHGIWMYDTFGTLMANPSGIGTYGAFTDTQHSCS